MAGGLQALRRGGSRSIPRLRRCGGGRGVCMLCEVCVGRGGEGLEERPTGDGWWCARVSSRLRAPRCSTHEEVVSLTSPEGRRSLGLDAALRLLAGARAPPCVRVCVCAHACPPSARAAGTQGGGSATSVAATTQAEWEAATAADDRALEAVDGQVRRARAGGGGAG